MEQKFVHRIIFVGFLILVLCLFYYQVLRGDYYLEKAKNNYVKISPLQSIRGSIFDRNSLPLATDRATFNIAVIPFQIEKKKERLFEEIAKESNYNLELIYKNYKRELINFFSPVNIIGDLEKSRALALAEKFNDDILINLEPKRFYSYPYEFAHLLGYVKKASCFYETLRKYGYSPLERAGLLGIEQFYDSYLKGEDGGSLIEVNSSGKIVGFLGQRLPQRGKGIHLTVDSAVQQIAYRALKGKDGVIILMNSQSGEIISLVCSPSFDPNEFVKSKGTEKFLKSQNKAMLNRAIQSNFALGSAIKPIIAAAGLSEQKITPWTTFNCEGEIKIGLTKFRCWNQHGQENLYQALAHSCNVYFYNLGLVLGATTIAKWFKKFGLDSLTEIDLPYEKKGLVPTPAWKSTVFKKRWFRGDTVNLSIGGGYLQASPLEILVAINVFANEGFLVNPYLLQKVDGVDFCLQKKEFIGLSAKNLKIIKQGLIEAVEQEDGTARLLKGLNLKIAGKTGTAQTNGKPHGWFVGFFPHDAPKYSLAVFLENAGSSFAALKIAYSFLNQLKEENLL